MILAMTIDLGDNAVMTTFKNSNILTHELRTQDISLFLLETGLKGHLDDIVRTGAASVGPPRAHAVCTNN